MTMAAPLTSIRAWWRKRIAVEVRDGTGAQALEYLSFDHDFDVQRLVYLPPYIDLVPGKTDLREQVASRLAPIHHRGDLDADTIILTSGSVEGIALVFRSLVNPSDEGIVEAASVPCALP